MIQCYLFMTFDSEQTRSMINIRYISKVKFDFDYRLQSTACSSYSVIKVTYSQTFGQIVRS